MNYFTNSDLTHAVSKISMLMEENKQRLIDLDSRIGDADLGLTMCKGYSAAEECAVKLDDEEIGIRLKKIGFAISKAAPSTMGTLTAAAFIGAGKALNGKVRLNAQDICTMFASMAAAVQERGKAREGDKTILDILFPVARAAQGCGSEDITDMMKSALDTARQSLTETKELMNRHGKASVFREKTIGLEDPGSAAAVLMIEGFAQACGVMDAHKIMRLD